MTRERALFAGSTDYTGVPLADVLDHLKWWHGSLASDAERLTNIRKRLSALGSESVYAIRDGLEMADHFLDVLERFRGDIERLEREIPRGVFERHVETAKQLYQGCVSEEKVCVHFKMEHHLDALNQDDEVQMTLAEIYRLTRQAMIDLKDLSNVVPRLKTFVGTEPIESKNESGSAVTALELKPNVFGIGLNLNYVWDRWGLPAWRRRRPK